MSTTQIFTVAGYIVGSYFGYPQLGAVIGGIVGSAVDTQTTVTRGPRLEDLRVQTSSYGTNIPYLFGTNRIAGNVIWAADLEEVASESDQGGKGGPSNSVITYTYFGTFAILLGFGLMKGVRRIFADAVLIYDGTVNPVLGDADWVFYRGDEEQLPDPTIEAAVGVGLTPAYRGFSYIVFNRLPLEKFGNRIPSITVEVTGDGEFAISGELLGENVTDSYATGFNQWAQRSDGKVVGVTYPNATSPSESTGIELRLFDQYTGDVLLTVDHDDVDGSVPVIRRNLSAYAVPADEVWVSCTGAAIVRYDAQTFDYVSTVHLFAGTPVMTWEPTNRRMYVRPNAAWVCAGGSQVVLGAGIFNIDVVRLSGAMYVAIDGTVAYEHDDAIITSLALVHLVDEAQGAAAVWDPTRHRYVVFTNRIWTVSDADPPVITVQNEPTGMFADDWGCASYDSATDSIVLMDEVFGTVICAVLDAETFALRASSSGVSGVGTAGRAQIFPQGPGTMFVLGSSRPWQLDFFGTTVAAVVERMGIESGLSADDMDVSELGIPLRGYAVSASGPARSAVEQLATDFFFAGVQEDDVVRFRRRGGDVVATIPLTDCGAGIDAPAAQAVQTTRTGDASLPAHVSVTAPDPAADYQPGAQNAERRVPKAGDDASWSTALVMTVDECKQLADALIFDAWASRQAYEWATGRAYAALSSTDPIMLGTARVRITSRTDQDGVIAWQGIGDDPEVISQSSTGVQGSFSGQTVPEQVPSTMVLMDMALLSDAGNTPGCYAAVWGAPPHWRGAVAYYSADDVSWNRMFTMPTPGSQMGVTVDALGDWSGGNVFDEVNTVQVAMHAGTTLSSTTREGVLDGGNAIAINGSDGWEVLQYRTAALQGDGTFILSGLLRGRRGTGWTTGGHDIGDEVVVLSLSNLRDAVLTNSLLGVSLAFKAVTVGDTIAATPEQDATIAGERLKPWSPVDFRAARDIGSGDITMTWKRRTRLACRFTGTVGINVPLGEATEAYSVEVWDSSYSTLKRTIAVTGDPTATYSASDQTTDFGSTQSTVYVRITQTSATVGAGHVLQAAA